MVISFRYYIDNLLIRNVNIGILAGPMFFGNQFPNDTTIAYAEIDAHITNCEIDSTSNKAIEFQEGKDLYVSNNVITNAEDAIQLVYACRNFYIEKNHVGYDTEGIIMNTVCRDGLIADNHVIRTGNNYIVTPTSRPTGAFVLVGLNTANAGLYTQNITWKNNIAETRVNDGLEHNSFFIKRLTSDSVLIRDVKILNNHFDDGISFNINGGFTALNKVENVQVRGNEMSHIYSSGIYTKGVYLSDNIITSGFTSDLVGENWSFNNDFIGGNLNFGAGAVNIFTRGLNPLSTGSITGNVTNL